MSSREELLSAFQDAGDKERIYCALLGRDVDATLCQGLTGKDMDKQCSFKPEDGSIFCGVHRNFMEKGLKVLEHRQRAAKQAATYTATMTRGALEAVAGTQAAVASALERTGMTPAAIDSATEQLRAMKVAAGASPFTATRVFSGGDLPSQLAVARAQIATATPTGSPSTTRGGQTITAAELQEQVYRSLSAASVLLTVDVYRLCSERLSSIESQSWKHRTTLLRER